MKRLIILLLSFSGITINAFAQLPVVDMTGNAELMAVNAELRGLNSQSQTTLTVLQTQLTLAQTIAQKTQKVTAIIKQLQSVERIVHTSANTVKSADRLLELAQSPRLNPTYALSLISNTRIVINNINSALSTTTMLLTDLKFDLSDKERMDAINDSLVEIERAGWEIDRLYKTTQRLTVKNELLNAF
ncbi:hypothetical protein [Parabacteroides goldsteinii]|uniref:hypothetical protein n=1 Tax=Parabacteroides goldsteinii TaxID=328812 RepID=UPI00259BE830|nr:hypothetical protein [Parabacteroides goldsteinii]